MAFGVTPVMFLSATEKRSQRFIYTDRHSRERDNGEILGCMYACMHKTEGKKRKGKLLWKIYPAQRIDYP